MRTPRVGRRARLAQSGGEPAVIRGMNPANPGYVIPLRALSMHDAGVDRSAGERPGPLREDQVPRSVVVERRLTNRALAAWQSASDDGMAPALAPFFDHSIVVRDPAGRAIIESVGGPVSARPLMCSIAQRLQSELRITLFFRGSAAHKLREKCRGSDRSV